MKQGILSTYGTQNEGVGASGDPVAIVRAFRFDCTLDPQILEKALECVLGGHSLLRTTFLPETGGALVALHAKNAPEGTWDAALDAAVRHAADSFNLSGGPLASAGLIPGSAGVQILFLCVHGIVAGLASLDSLLAEWSACYDALRAGEPVPGSAEHIRPGFRRDRLRAPLPPMELPAERSCRAGKTFLGKLRQIVFSSEVSAAIRASARQEEASPPEVCLAALNVLLTRYAGTEDVTVEAIIDPRPGAGMHGAIGPFETRLLLRTDLSGDPCFRDVLRRVRETIAKAKASQDVPYEAVLEALHSDPPRGDAAAFPVEFHWLETPPGIFCLGGVAGVPVAGTTEREISFTLWDDGDAIHAHTSCGLERFDGETIDGLLEHFELLAAGLVASPHQPLSAIPILTPAETRLQSDDWNRTEAAFPRDTLVHHLFEGQAGRVPCDVAVEFGDKRLTYGELNERANRLARYLLRCGLRSDTPVGICMERSLEMAVAILAIAKAGGAYLPLDPLYPSDRLAFMMEDSQAAILVTEGAVANRLTLPAPRTVRVDADSDEIDRENPEDLPRLDADPSRLAYILYTSGSTGRPKGVPVSHRSLVNLLCDMERRLGFTVEDRLLSVTTLSFDIATMEVFLPLVTGGRLILVSRADAIDGIRLAARVEQSGATVMQATPATWQLLVESGWRGDPKLRLVTGGEALTWSLAHKLLDRCGSLWNQYGPTETTIYSTSWKVEPCNGPILIGRPISNTTIRILDSHGQPVPTGVAGELCIGGEGLMRGYLNLPDLTARALIRDPFRGGELFYRSGDLARYQRDGAIEYLGRIDHQVKIHGFRIEPGEIESVLRSHPGIAEAVVIAWDDPSRGKRLVAYVVSAGEPKPSVTVLRLFLKQKLTDYMVPSAFEWIAGVPRTPNGKVNRHALPAPSSERPELGRQYVAPRNPRERELAAVWERALGIRPIGVTDNYFDLGADSLTTARVFGRIEKQFGRRISPTVLFQAPTVERLAELLGARTDDLRERSCLVPIRTTGAAAPLFCIHGGAGTVLFFYNLARHLGENRPVYALQARGLYGEVPPDTRVEQMAERYIGEIRRVQPEGPYYLAGYCFGAIVAFEMAQRLRRDGQEIALLASLNGPCPRYANSPGDRNDGGRRPLGERITKLLRYFWFKSVRWRAESAIAHNRPVPERLRDDYFLVGSFRAERLYAAQAYSGRMALFEARGLYNDSCLGWSDLAAGGLEVHEIPGDHRTHRTMMEEPIVAVLAEALHRELNRIGN